ncbi:hypothetical protein GQ44DRAFT_775418 [Phaeosphaeriaceae sp. PMI808]|nr:hypothetical protein GQ44DRAFT_775418 [Phaeosphaeriaceae sp. PMI808]
MKDTASKPNTTQPRCGGRSAATNTGTQGRSDEAVHIAQATDEYSALRIALWLEENPKSAPWTPDART